MRTLIAALSVLTLLSACASLSREECAAGDWAGIGARDGAAGRDEAVQFERHVSACARVDIVPDRAAWSRGYSVGLQQYCTPRRGVSEGEAGRLYRGVCPAASEPGFLRGYELGLTAHRQRLRIREIESEISSLRRTSIVPVRDADGVVWREIRANQSEILFLQLKAAAARAELARIEREIRAFRAAL